MIQSLPRTASRAYTSGACTITAGMTTTSKWHGGMIPTCGKAPWVVQATYFEGLPGMG